MFPIFVTLTTKPEDEFVVLNIQGIKDIWVDVSRGTLVNRIDAMPLHVNQTPDDIRRLINESIVDTVWDLAEEFKQRERDLAAGKGGKNGGKRGS